MWWTSTIKWRSGTPDHHPRHRAYVGAGLFAGLLISAAVPPLNAIGIGYYALTWPAQVYCARLDRGCGGVTPSPKWARYMFTFDDH